jgi:hypothetical protein
MKGSHNLSTCKNDKKMLDDKATWSLQINFLVTSQNNQMNYISLLNHNNLGMIWNNI